MAGKTLEIRFPLAGVARRLGLDMTSDKGPPSTPWSVNCRPEDPLSNRLRGGSRVGLTDYTNTVEWPTGELLSEGGEELVDEDGFAILDEDGVQMQAEGGVPILTEAGDEVLGSVTANPALNPSLIEAINAFGVGELPEAISATVGTAPIGLVAGCMYRDRMVVAGDQIVYMSRQGDYTDWDYGADVEDQGRAFLYQLSQAGELGDDITALVPHRDAVLFAATSYSLWVLKGDPAAGGTLENVSRDVGMVSSTAWTKVQDTIVFLSHDGLYSVQANGEGLKDLSGDKLPVELQDIDLTTVSVMLGYKHGDRGVYIFMSGGSYHWYFDLELAGFWPFTLPTANDPVRVFQVDDELVLWDGDAGYWTIGGADDDGTDIGSHVLLGPFRAEGPGGEFGLLSAIHGVVQTDEDGSVTWRIVSGDTAEGVCEDAKAAVTAYIDEDLTTANSYVKASGTWTSRRNYMDHPRVRGMWLVIWLQSTDVWAFESIVAEMHAFQRWR